MWCWDAQLEMIEVKSGVFEGDQVVTQGAPMLYAQSLRGGSKKANEHSEAPAQTNANSNNGMLPWWMLLPVGGAIATGTFFASTYWANRRHRKQLATVMDGADYVPDGTGNGQSHNGLTAFSAESHKSETSQPSAVQEAQKRPTKNN
jgi:membrane fusion protein, heavy metal efflux system